MGFLAEQNLKMLGSTLTASLFLTVSIFYLMQWLIDVGDVELDNTSIKIADVTMPERELELLMDMERPQERIRGHCRDQTGLLPERHGHTTNPSG